MMIQHQQKERMVHSHQPSASHGYPLAHVAAGNMPNKTMTASCHWDTATAEIGIEGQ